MGHWPANKLLVDSSNCESRTKGRKEAEERGFERLEAVRRGKAVQIKGWREDQILF